MKFLLLLLLSLIWGCANTTTIKFESIPAGAKIFVRTLKDPNYKEVGQTPALLKSTELEKDFHGSGPIEVEMRKEGFSSSKMLITELSEIDLKISMDLVAESGLEDQEKLNWILDEMFEVKRLAKAKQLKKALSKLKEIKIKLPRVAAIYELEGGIYYLQNKFRAALESYRMAVRYNPKNPETIRMRDKLERNLGRGE